MVHHHNPNGCSNTMKHACGHCPTPYISKTSKCLISLNLLKRKKKVLNAIIFKEIKKNFKEILALKILRLLIALKHSFKSFKGQKALFKPFDIFLMYPYYHYC